MSRCKNFVHVPPAYVTVQESKRFECVCYNLHHVLHLISIPHLLHFNYLVYSVTCHHQLSIIRSGGSMGVCCHKLLYGKLSDSYPSTRRRHDRVWD